MTGYLRLEDDSGSSTDVPIPMDRAQSWDNAESSTARPAHFRRPRTWVLMFGWSLAINAGMVNVIGFICFGTYVSHMTGTTTDIGMRLEGSDIQGIHSLPLGDALFVLLSFVAGAFACGMLIDKNQVHFGGKSYYGLALVAESIPFAVAPLLAGKLLPACLLSWSCGLQNAMCTSHFGAIIRTTHVTGTATDIGSTLGRLAMIYLRKRRRPFSFTEHADINNDVRRLGVLLPMWTAFVSGTVLGTYFHAIFGLQALWFNASFTMIVGLVYTAFRPRLKRLVRHIEQERLARNVVTVRASLERANYKFHHYQERRASKSSTVHEEEDGGLSPTKVVRLTSDFEDLLERVRDVEDGLDFCCREQP